VITKTYTPMHGTGYSIKLNRYLLSKKRSIEARWRRKQFLDSAANDRSQNLYI